MAATAEGGAGDEGPTGRKPSGSRDPRRPCVPHGPEAAELGQRPRSRGGCQLVRLRPQQDPAPGPPPATRPGAPRAQPERTHLCRVGHGRAEKQPWPRTSGTSCSCSVPEEAGRPRATPIWLRGRGLAGPGPRPAAAGEGPAHSLGSQPRPPAGSYIGPIQGAQCVCSLPCPRP